jgi:hypothetical protein
MTAQVAASAKLFVTKLGAAERQLNAAIRMILSGEDELAVHTVAAAAYRLLRDIKQSRGRNPVADLYAHGLLGFAKDVAAGKPLPPDITIAPTLVAMIKGIAQEITKGVAPTPSEVASRLSLSSVKNYWRDLSATANFLKHADRDLDAVLPLDKIEERNKELLSFSCAAYIDTLGHSTPEMEAFVIFAHGGDAGFSTPFWSGEYSERLRKASPARRRRVCRHILKVLKKEGHYRIFI